MKAIFRMWPVTDIDALGVKCLMKSMMWYFPGGPVLRLCASKPGGAGSILGQETEVLYSAGGNQKNTKKYNGNEAESIWCKTPPAAMH